MVKPNRGRDWLDWQRKLLIAAKWIGLTAVILMAGSLLIGEMGVPRYLSMRAHMEQLGRELTDLQHLNTELRTDIDRVQYDSVRIEELAVNGWVMYAKAKLCINWLPYESSTLTTVEGPMKWGTVAIIGRSNVGKSTLLNRLLNEKVAIVSDKPQTTRTRILGIAHVRGAQIAFLDTPGLHEPQHLLNRRMVRTTLETFEDADVIYVVVDATAQPGPGDRIVVRHIQNAVAKHGRPIFLAVNKVDLVNKSKLLPVLQNYSRLFPWTEIVPVSARSGDNVKRLLDITVALLPEGSGPYKEDMVTDQPMRTLAAELIREKILAQTYEEIPHAVAVEIEQFQETGKLARISAAILVEKESQKAIVIGKHGERLKQVGSAARKDMERLFGMKVFLEMWVKVREAWREDELVLTELGY